MGDSIRHRPRSTAVLELEARLSQLSNRQRRDFRLSNLYRLLSGFLLPGSVLDVGCGAGGFVEYLLRAGIECGGIDVNETIVRSAKSHLEECGLDSDVIRCVGIDEVVENGERYENIVSMDCLEHVEDDLAMLRSLGRAAKKGGRMILTVPAVPALFGPHDRAVGHYRRYSREALRQLGRSAGGLRLERIRYWNLLGVPVVFGANLAKREVKAEFRYRQTGTLKRLLGAGLYYWFRWVENPMNPPIGLTLIAVFRKE